MTSAQPQLLQISLDPHDVVYTPDWAAQDIVNYFKPSGAMLEPCKGLGAFLKHMPGADWCEISEGRDFFAWTKPVDWIVSNPPFSLLYKWLNHSFSVAENIVYLVPLWKFFGSHKLMKDTRNYGGIVHIRVYGTGGKLDFPLGNTVGAMYFKRGYQGDTSWSWYA